MIDKLRGLLPDWAWLVISLCLVIILVALVVLFVPAQ